jgi:division protein CdvB (Snf7/Vps24/ESCRT-III family)
MIFKKKKIDPIRETVYAIYNLKRGINRLEALMDRIMSRRKRMLEIAAQLEARGESFLAKKYAAEIAKLDKIYSRLADLKLVLEKISISLEYTLSLRNFQSTARDIAALLNDLKRLPETTIPEIGLMITNLEHSIKNLEETDYDIIDLPDITYASDRDVGRIIEEAREILRKKLETEMSTSGTGSMVGDNTV